MEIDKTDDKNLYTQAKILASRVSFLNYDEKINYANAIYSAMKWGLCVK